MAKYPIKEVAVTPALPPDYIVFRREDIYRFVAAARRTVADLQEQLDAERALHAAARRDDVLEPTDVPPDEPWGPYKKPLFSLPDWTEPGPTPADNTSFFESLRDTDEPLIAGAERAAVDDDGDEPSKPWVFRATVAEHPSMLRRRAQ